MTSDSIARTAKIARLLGMRAPSKGPSGRYLRESTATKQINAIVFHRDGFDCVGLEGTGNKRQWVINNDARWKKLGFRPHQSHPDDHKGVATYIQEFLPPPDGKVDVEMRKASRNIHARLHRNFTHSDLMSAFASIMSVIGGKADIEPRAANVRL